MSQSLGKAERLIGRIARLFALASGVALLWLMLFIVYAEMARYLFGAPLFGAHDVARMSLVVVVFFGLAWGGWTGGHISVDLVGGMVPPRLLRLIDAPVRLLSAVLVAVMGWRAAMEGLDAREFGEATNLVEIPLFPFFLVAAFGFAVYALVLLAQAACAMRGKVVGSGP